MTKANLLLADTYDSIIGTQSHLVLFPSGLLQYKLTPCTISDELKSNMFSRNSRFVIVPL